MTLMRELVLYFRRWLIWLAAVNWDCNSCVALYFTLFCYFARAAILGVSLCPDTQYFSNGVTCNGPWFNNNNTVIIIIIIRQFIRRRNMSIKSLQWPMILSSYYYQFALSCLQDDHIIILSKIEFTQICIRPPSAIGSGNPAWRTGHLPIYQNRGLVMPARSSLPRTLGQATNP